MPTDDLPKVNINNFERVSIITENDILKVEPTFILPKNLTDDGSDSILKTVYDDNDIIFDPDSRIKSIIIEVANTSSEDASLQDKLSLGDNSTGFNVTSGAGTNKIILSISEEDFSNISLSQNQEHVLEVLRNVKYSNDAEISNLISGFQGFKNWLWYETHEENSSFNTINVFDSSQNSSLPKLFIDSNFKTVNYSEGSGFASSETQNNIDLFDNINVSGRSLPQKVTVKIEDFVEGDLLFSGSNVSNTGELILTLIQLKNILLW